MSKDHGFSPTDLASGPGKSRARPGDAIKEVFPVGAKGEPTQVHHLRPLLERSRQGRSEINRSRKWCSEQLHACPDTLASPGMRV